MQSPPAGQKEEQGIFLGLGSDNYGGPDANGSQNQVISLFHLFKLVNLFVVCKKLLKY